MISEKSKEVFENQHVFTEHELHSRYEVLIEHYLNKVGIEADLLEEMSRTFILPAAHEHLNKLGELSQPQRHGALKIRRKAWSRK